MSTATARAPQPGKEKGRLAGRPFGTSVFTGCTKDSASTLRLQCLERIGIFGPRADLIAGLIWGGSHG